MMHSYVLHSFWQVMHEEYEAARILCEKTAFYHLSVPLFISIVSSFFPPVLECKPSNTTSEEFLPVCILEQLRLFISRAHMSPAPHLLPQMLSYPQSQAAVIVTRATAVRRTVCVYVHCI